MHLYSGRAPPSLKVLFRGIAKPWLKQAARETWSGLIRSIWYIYRSYFGQNYNITGLLVFPSPLE